LSWTAQSFFKEHCPRNIIYVYRLPKVVRARTQQYSTFPVNLEKEIDVQHSMINWHKSFLGLQLSKRGQPEI